MIKILYLLKNCNIEAIFAKLQLEIELECYFPLKKSEKKPTSV